jgi:nucleoid-associated protein EbfC
MSSIGKLMKQAARMQQQMETVQAQLAARTVEATSGGGAVKVIAKCDGSIASIKIDPQALNPSEPAGTWLNLIILILIVVLIDQIRG